MNEEDKDVLIEQICNDKNFEKSDIEIEINESIEEVNFPQEYDGANITLEDLNEKKTNDPRVQCSNDLDIINYLYKFLVKLITNYQREQQELKERSIIYSNLIIIAMYKTSTKIKRAWT